MRRELPSPGEPASLPGAVSQVQQRPAASSSKSRSIEVSRAHAPDDELVDNMRLPSSSSGYHSHSQGRLGSQSSSGSNYWNRVDKSASFSPEASAHSPLAALSGGEASAPQRKTRGSLLLGLEEDGPAADTPGAPSTPEVLPPPTLLRANTKGGSNSKRAMSRTTTLKRMLTGRSLDPKRKQGVKLPYWMTEDLVKQTFDAVWSSSTPRELLRVHNVTMQTELAMWSMLQGLSRKMGKGGREREVVRAEAALIQYIEEQREHLKSRHGADHEWTLVHDSVGSLPLHVCFLLGLTDLGKRIVARYYNSPRLVSTPYTSDLAAWREVGVLDDNDGIDDGGMYTGETILHIAIVNEDRELVEWLLERGIDIGGRARGVFFSPQVVRKEVDAAPSAWQRVLAFVQERDLKNDPIVVTTRPADSACYYGEFPLSFAASIGDVDACALLRRYFKKGLESHDPYVAGLYDYSASKLTTEGQELRSLREKTNSQRRLHATYGEYSKAELANHAAFQQAPSIDFFVNAQDSHGNTALHLAVLHERKLSVDWLVANGGDRSLHLLNDDGFTPLTLAARIGSTDMFHHVLGCMRETVWSYGNVHMTKTPLVQIDTYRIKKLDLHERPKWRSSLGIIVRHEIGAFSDDELFNRLIKDKWNTFGRSMYIWRTFVPYCLMLSLFTVMLTLHCDHKRTMWHKQLSKGGSSWEARKASGFDFAAGWEEKPLEIAVMQTVLVGLGVPWLLYMGWKQRRLGPKDYDPDEDGDITATEMMMFVFKNSSFFLDYSGSITMVVAYILSFGRDLDSQRMELQLWACSSILLWCNLLNVIMPFEFFGILVIIIYKMLIGDFFKFLAVYFIMIAAFSQAIFCLFQMPELPSDTGGLDEDPLQAFLKLVWVSLGDVDDVGLINRTRDPSLTLTVYMIWVMLSTVLLINLLIAMMGQTFTSDMEDTHKAWVFPFAHLVLTYEKMLSPYNRARHRTGVPGRAEYEGDKTDETLREEPFFEIFVHENRQKLAEQDKALEDKRAHKMVLDAVQNYGEGMNECVTTLKAMQSALEEAEGEGKNLFVDSVDPKEVKGAGHWLPGEECALAPAYT